MLTVLQLFTGSGTHAAFREMTKKIVEKYGRLAAASQPAPPDLAPPSVLRVLTSASLFALLTRLAAQISRARSRNLRYTPERPGLSVSLVRTGARHDKSSIEDQLERVPIKHYVELTSCEAGLMDLFEREHELY